MKLNGFKSQIQQDGMIVLIVFQLEGNKKERGLNGEGDGGEISDLPRSFYRKTACFTVTNFFG